MFWLYPVWNLNMTDFILSRHVNLEYFGLTEDYFLSFIRNLLFAAFLSFWIALSFWELVLYSLYKELWSTKIMNNQMKTLSALIEVTDNSITKTR